MNETVTCAQEGHAESGMVLIQDGELISMARYLYEAARETYSAPTDNWDDLTGEAKNMWNVIAQAAHRWAQMEQASDD